MKIKIRISESQIYVKRSETYLPIFKVQVRGHHVNFTTHFTERHECELFVQQLQDAVNIEDIRELFKHRENYI